MPSFPFRTIPPTIIRGSGIGSSKYLAEAQVHRVGENYQDHNLVTIPYPASEDSDCIDSITNGDAELIKCKFNDPDF
ncbi:hypothetical protein F5051DRAFT_440058 [Lentinula edodes]|uniref:Uncharacterized protein n=1 Tax=Lentinula lateritia TaxID=40482 RepID=A0A9W9AXM3_9AGAR|nr:hypothetical protein F5051DRAFT_440058 [Lentinula edodes]KAJ3919629.1 hypothetical protein F5877DRAFT_77912 [Lentinula edodes]KAJ4491543.1 hypothetical protein C8J55DRAFT_557115 [Lentinula edodes]